MKAKTSAHIDQFQSQIDAINKEIPRTRPSKRESLIAQRDAVQGAIGLHKAILEGIGKMSSFVETTGEAGHGLEGDINRLAQSIPEVLGRTNPQAPVAPKPPPKSNLANSGGLVGEAMTLYDYMSAVHQIDGVIKERLHA